MLRTCPRDHDPDQWRVTPHGKWKCRECERGYGARYREKHGYAPDATVSLLIVAGEHRGYVHRDERREAVRMMRLKGFSLALMAQNALCDVRQVSRIIKSLKESGEIDG